MGQTFRRLAICYHRVRESVARGACRFGKIETELNLADLFSKVLPEPSRHRLLNGIIWRESYGLREVEKNGMKKMVHFCILPNLKKSLMDKGMVLGSATDIYVRFLSPKWKGWKCSAWNSGGTKWLTWYFHERSPCLQRRRTRSWVMLGMTRREKR